MVSCFALDRCRYTALCRSLRHVGRVFPTSLGRAPTEFPSDLLQHLKASLFSVFTRHQGTNEASWYHRIFLRIASKRPLLWHFSEKMKFQSNCGPSSMTHRIVHLLCAASKAKSGQDLLIVSTEFISNITSSTVISQYSWWFMVLPCLSCRFTPNLHDFLETFAKLLEPKPWSLAAPTPQRSVPCPAGSITSHGPRPQHLSFVVNSVETDYLMISTYISTIHHIKRSNHASVYIMHSYTMCSDVCWCMTWSF